MIKMVLFDLGGVVISVSNEKYYSYLSKISGLSEKEVEFRLKEDIVPYERGAITINRFSEIVSNDLGIKRRQILWKTYFRKISSLNKGTAEVIRKLKKNYKVSFLSNVDKDRYETGAKYILKDIMPLFTYTFVSYKLKSVKPSPLIFRQVLGKMRLKPNEVAFIDNDMHNVYEARKLGMRAIHFTGVNALKKDLKRLGLKF